MADDLTEKQINTSLDEYVYTADDKVVEGDMVKAYVTDKGHVTTLQRVEP